MGGVITFRYAVPFYKHIFGTHSSRIVCRKNLLLEVIQIKYDSIQQQIIFVIGVV